MDLFASLQATRRAGSYVSPKMYAPQSAALDPSLVTTSYTRNLAPDVNPDPWFQTVTGSVLAAPVDIVDSTVALFGGKRGGTNEWFYKDVLHNESMANWVRDNHGSVEVASGLIGAVAVGYAAELAVGKLLTSGFMAATGLSRVATQVLPNVQRAKAIAAEATYEAALAGQTLRWYQGANWSLVKTKIVTGVGKAAVSEIAIVAALNKNSMIWSDDMSQNFMWGALGLGFGGGVGFISGRGAVSRYANSDAIKLAFADAADPHGFERALVSLPQGGTSDNALAVPKPTSIVTDMLLNARADDSLQAGNLSAVRNSMQMGIRKQAEEVLHTVTRQGIDGAKGSQFQMVKGDAASQHASEAMYADPTIFYGAESIGKVPDHKSVDDVFKDRTTELDSMLKSKKPALIREAQRKKRQTPLAIINNSPMTIDDARPFLNFDEASQVYARESNTNGINWVSQYSGKKYRLLEDGRINTDMMTAPIQDVIGITHAMGHLIPKLKALKIPVTVPKKATVWQIDFAVELEKQGGIVDWTVSGIKDSESARIVSLGRKSELAGNNPLDAHARFRLNLPFATSVERLTDPDGAGFKSIIKGATQVGATIDGMKSMRRDANRLFEVSQDVKYSDGLDGDVFNFNRSAGKGKQWLEPLVAFYDETDSAKWHKSNISDDIAETNVAGYTALRSSRRAPLTSRLTDTILSHPAVKRVMELSGLSDSAIHGTDNAVGASLGQAVSKAHTFRYTEELAGAQDIRRVVNRQTELHIDSVLMRLKPHADRLAQATGAPSKVLLNQYLSNSAGWDIAKTEVLADGKIAFLLNKNSPINRARLGREVEDGEYMRSEKTGKAIVLDQSSDQARLALESEFKALLAERNAVRRSFGLDEIAYRPFYTPPQRTKGMLIGFTIDAQNRTVPGGAVVAATQGEFDSAAELVKKGLKPGQRFMSELEIRDMGDLWERAGLDFIDPSRMAGPSGVRRGSLSSKEIDSTAMEKTFSYLKESYEQNANGVVRKIFQRQLGVAEIRSSAQPAKAGVKNIWQVYHETLMGIPASANPTGLNKIFHSAEEWVDSVLAWPAGVVSSNHVRDVFDKVGVSGRTIKNSKEFTSLSNALAEHTPFAGMTDYARYELKLKEPPTMAKIARGLNRIASGVILRWLEIPHAAMNMAGIITNMPGLLSTGGRSVPSSGHVRGVRVVDSMKIMSKGFTRMLSERSGLDWEEMVRNGDTTQDVAELHKQLVLANNHSKFMNLVLGKPEVAQLPKTAPLKDRAANFIERKGIEGIASIFSDTSESMSRRWAHFVGLELADLHGIVGQTARHNFARKIANDAIANYDPLNRPEIYQSAFGSMYGLFLSYAQNYYQRLFRWIEDDQYAAVGKSLATQAAMFGFMGVPGTRQLAGLIGGEEDGTGLMDGIYERWGPAAGNVIAHGGLNQVINLFGLIPNVPSLALHTRGDANFRHPAGDFLVNGKIPTPPGVEVLLDIIRGTTQIIGGIVDPNQPMSARYAAEIMARNMPNRMIHGALTVLAAGGQDTDVNGNVMAETQNIVESLYRFLGLRSSRQQSEIEAYFLNQQALAKDAQRMDVLRGATRALARSGDFDRLPEVFEDYLAAGGKPWNYTPWIERVVEEATKTRTQNQLLKALRSPSMQNLAYRILLFTGG